MLGDLLVEARQTTTKSAIWWSEDDPAAREALVPALTHRTVEHEPEVDRVDLDDVLEVGEPLVARWRAAEIAYSTALESAKHELLMSTGEPRLLRLALLDRRARQRYRRRVVAAAEAYRPTDHEIAEHLAAPATRRLQRTLEAFERAGDTGRRVVLDDGAWRERYRAVGREEVWGLVAPRDAEELWVFRHDVRTPADLPEGHVRRGTPLSAAGLEAELIGDSRPIAWDEASCLATELACGPGPHLSFDTWWDAVTRESWPAPDRRPRPPDPPPSTTSRRGYGPSSDYGGSYGFGGSW